MLEEGARFDIILEALDSLFEEMYDPSSFSYQDYEEHSSRGLCHMANLRILLIMSRESDESQLKEAVIWWMEYMTKYIPIGWDEARLTMLKESVHWRLAQKALDGEIPFSSLRKPPQRALEQVDNDPPASA